MPDTDALAPAPAPCRGSNGERLLWLLAGLTALAFAFRTLAALPLTSLWEDELSSAMKSFQPSLLQLARYLRNDVHPPLYYGLLWAAGQLMGQTTIVLRGFSWLAYIAAAGTLARACWLWSRSQAAAVMAGVLALSLPFTVRFAVEGKGYALLVLLLCLAVHFRIRLLKGDAAAAGGCALFWSAAALTHYYGMGLLLCQAALDGWRRRSPWRPLAWALVLPTLWMLLNLRVLAGSRGREWIPPVDGRLFQVLLHRGLGSHWPQVLLLAGLLGLVLWLTSTPNDRRLSALVTAWGLDAGVLLLVGSVLVSTVKPSAVPRYYIVLVPACVGIVACWLGVQLSTSRGWPWRRWLVGGVMAAVLCLFWRDAYLPIMPPGPWAGTRQHADYRTLVLLAASAEQKFAPSPQCGWLTIYDQLLSRENVIRPRSFWQCLPARPPSAGAARASFAAGRPELVVAATMRTADTSAFQELAPYLEGLQAGGLRCVEDLRSTGQARGFHCRRIAPDPGSGAPQPGR